VVGVDGSEGANAALRFAIGEAELRKARLRIVAAWGIPIAAFGGGFAPPLESDTLEAFRDGAQRVADEALATAKEQWPSVEAEAVTLEGQPAEVLLAQAADATLIVVGNRGLGGFTSLLLGSVSQHVVHHASCPVVVVHRPPARPSG
jgi:nucleotide-binding universal stress UspA family protein